VGDGTSVPDVTSDQRFYRVLAALLLVVVSAWAGSYLIDGSVTITFPQTAKP
jgi:hypothetical protein